MAISQPDLSDSITAAPALLGWKLVHDGPEGRVAGYIVETEAYRQEDPASHSFRGPGMRNAVMFGPAGHIYVYFTYGMHFCMNIVTGPKGRGQAVLLRALEPVEGVELMQRRRGIEDIRKLASGPARLTEALGIGREHNGLKLGSNIRLEPGPKPENIVQTSRVGITKAIDQPWRFYIKDNPFVSRK